MKHFWEETGEKKVNKKKITISIITGVIIVLIGITAVIYNKNTEFREWIDKNILRKEVMQDNVTTIELKDENSKIYAFNKYIGVLSKNNFNIYNSVGNEEKNLVIEITNPIFDSSNRFLVIAENKGQKAYLITDKEISWETKIEGNISQIHVNKNGYVAITIVDTSYKTVIAMFDPQGKEMFKTYLSTTRTADICISNDNKYLAIGEIDTQGTIIQSNIKIVSIEKAQQDPTNSIEKVYNGESNSLITNIKYQEKNKLVCMYTDKIQVIEGDTTGNLSENENKKITFSSIELSNHSVTLEEKSSGLFTADSIVHIINTSSKKKNTYTVSEVTKEIYTYEDIIALNLGAEVEFININANLVKRYIAKQEITNIVVSNNIAGILYRDKIEVINL